MSYFRPVSLDHASRLLNHGPTVLITSRDESIDSRHVMAAAWSMPVEFSPARIAFAVDKSAWLRALLALRGMFGFVVLGAAATYWTHAACILTGREVD